MSAVLRSLLMGGSILIVSPDDLSTAFVAAYVSEVDDHHVRHVITSPATFDRGTAMLRILGATARLSCCSELSWLDDFDLDDAELNEIARLIMRTWLTDACLAVTPLLAGATPEMTPSDLTIVICEHEKLAAALACAILSMENPASCDGGVRVIESGMIPGGGPAFLLHVEHAA